MTEMLDADVPQLCDVAPTPAANYGEVFTRRWVVELILDLSRYTTDRDLTALTVVEPAVGGGAFLGPIVERLLEARTVFACAKPWEALANAIVAWDVQHEHVIACRRLACDLLLGAGCPRSIADELAEGWVRPGDFLLDGLNGVRADVVVGNPPYIRIEDLDADLLAAYRQACPAMGGRADVYIGFYERGLDVLAPDGVLGFICADRWMRNQYGRRLREKIISGGFSVDACLVMHDVAAFDDDVAAYPAITVLRRGGQGKAVTGEASAEFDEHTVQEFAAWHAAGGLILHSSAVSAARLPHWHDSADSWPDASPDTIAWLEELADIHPAIEHSAPFTRIGIGVATGADAVYVTKESNVVETERLLPLAMPEDVKSGAYSWQGAYLVNPWDEDGLIDLDDWPHMASYLRRNGTAVRRRSIARRNPRYWYRTIDRVTVSLTDRPKLLLEDMKARPNPVLEAGGRYPHHNLYYVVSEGWNLEELGGLLLSEVIEKQIVAYCVKMRGKTLRFQAQYLRRVRVPRRESIAAGTRDALATAFRSRDRDMATAAALDAFRMSTLPA